MGRDLNLLFVSPEAFLGRTLREVMPGELGEMFMAAVERARRGEEPVVVEYELSMDQVRHFEARLVRSDENCIISIVGDVTELRRAAELNRGLARRLIVSQEQERRRIARELHDDLGQRIALLNLEVDQIAGAVRVQSHRTRLERCHRKSARLPTTCPTCRTRSIRRGWRRWDSLHRCGCCAARSHNFARSTYNSALSNCRIR